jgi:hypothetical protein
MSIRMLKGTKRAQSAMEYLMTYGWAILIIAVVLGALFSLGVFSGSSLIGNACIAGPGFLCQSMIVSHTTGQLSVQIGQSTGSSWGSSLIVFAVQGSALGTNGFPIVYSTGNYYASGALVSGQTATATFSNAMTAGSAVGATLAGAIWACYTASGYTGTVSYVTGATGGCTQQANTIYYTQIATLTAKAT